MGDLINSGDFSRGIHTDDIGIQDSLLDAYDVMIDRDGEIRSRGQKTLARAVPGVGLTYGNTGRGGHLIDDLVDRFAITVNDGGRGRWLLCEPDMSDHTWNTTTGPVQTSLAWGINNVESYFGGGPHMTAVNQGLASSAPGYNDDGVGYVGIWGGQMDNVPSPDVEVDFAAQPNSKVLVDTLTGDGFPNIDPVGLFLSFEDGDQYIDPTVQYRVLAWDPTSGNLYLDKPMPSNLPPSWGVTTQRWRRVIKLYDPNGVGVGSSRVIESHAGRLFAAGGSYPTVDGEPAESSSRVRWSGTDRDFLPSNPPNPLAFTNQNRVYGEHVWYEDAYIDVYDNVGGRITGLRSLGGNLMVLKEQAIAIIRGTVTTQAFPSSVSVDIVSTDVGCPQDLAHDSSRLGVVFANKEGLWAFDGTSLNNLVDGRVTLLWAEMFGNDFHSKNIRVSSVGNRVFVNDEGDSEYLIYDMSDQRFTRQRSGTCRTILKVDDREIALNTDNDELIDFAGDFNYTTGTDANDSNYPQMSITTTHLPNAGEPFLQGRPNTIYIAGMSTGTLSVELSHGRVQQDIEVDALEYTFDAQAYDDMQRIPIDGVRSRPAFRLKVEQDTPGTDTRLYAVGIDIERDTRYGH